MDISIEGGFAEQVADSQSTFRAAMEALARPGLPQPLRAEAAPPPPLTPELGAIALTLCDHDSPVWLDARLAASPEVIAWLQFHTGAPITADPAEAQFAFVSGEAELPRLEVFAQGSAEYPDRSTTVVLAASASASTLTLRGPGIKEQLVAELGLPGGDFLAQWAENRARFPRGVDLLLVGDRQVVGLPRTTRISEG